MKCIGLILSLSILTGCMHHNGVQQAEAAPIQEVSSVDIPEGVSRVATDVRDDVHRSANKLKDWVLSSPEPKVKQAVPASYCYQSLQDVLCYRQPMPGWEARLVGYQGTDAPAPPPAVMQPLPVRASNLAMSPTNRANNAKPLVQKAANTAKTEEAAVEGEVIKAITVDAAHESLPDPALAPQL